MAVLLHVKMLLIHLGNKLPAWLPTMSVHRQHRINRAFCGLSASYIESAVHMGWGKSCDDLVDGDGWGKKSSVLASFSQWDVCLS